MCSAEILGECEAAFALTPIEGMHDPDAAPIYIHGELCFSCTACVGVGSGEICKRAVAFGEADPTTGARKCHVGQDNLPVCSRHIDTHALEFPSFDPATEAKQALAFMKSWGFAKMRTTMKDAHCDEITVWMSKLIGLMSGWDDATTERKLQESNWDVGTHYSGHDRGEFGVVTHAKPIEGDSNEINSLRANSYRAEPIAQVREEEDVFYVSSDVLVVGAGDLGSPGARDRLLCPVHGQGRFHCQHAAAAGAGSGD